MRKFQNRHFKIITAFVLLLGIVLTVGAISVMAADNADDEASFLNVGNITFIASESVEELNDAWVFAAELNISTNIPVGEYVGIYHAENPYLIQLIEEEDMSEFYEFFGFVGTITSLEGLPPNIPWIAGIVIEEPQTLWCGLLIALIFDEKPEEQIFNLTLTVEYIGENGEIRSVTSNEFYIDFFSDFLYVSDVWDMNSITSDELPDTWILFKDFDIESSNLPVGSYIGMQNLDDPYVIEFIEQDLAWFDDTNIVGTITSLEGLPPNTKWYAALDISRFHWGWLDLFLVYGYDDIPEEQSLSLTITVEFVGEDGETRSVTSNVFASRISQEVEERWSGSLFSFGESNERLMTRGDAITWIYDLMWWEIELPDVSGMDSPFYDVDVFEWYAEAVIWAHSVGIIQGIGGGLFAPSDYITRQDFAVMINNLANYVELELPILRELQEFNDHADIAYYAIEAVERLFKSILIESDEDGNFNPRDVTTFSDMSAMSRKFLNLWDVFLADANR